MRRRPDHHLAIALREWAGGAFVVLVVGRLVYYKGIDVLLDALSMTRHMRLVVAGDGPLRARLEARSAALGVADRIKWLGTVTDDELVGAFSAADVFVLPSVARSEAFGLVQVEAMAAGLPVVSTRLGTSVEIVNVDGSTGIVVEPNVPATLADAIQTIADDAALRARLAAGALRRAEDFAETRLVDRYRDLYAAAMQ
jgi:rhamnosyl/mannosyltransferase